jgi:lincosamide nucleotidyltransferase A/C/D/E
LASRLRSALLRAGANLYSLIERSPAAGRLRLRAVDAIETRLRAMRTSEVLAVLRALDEADVPAWVQGGWGVDALVGGSERPHRDLDLVLSGEHEDRALRALERAGYGIRVREAVCEWIPVRLWLQDRSRRFVDLKPGAFPFSKSAPPGAERLVEQIGIDPSAAFATGVLGGHPVPCLSAEVQLAAYNGYPQREIDRLDVARLREHLAARRSAPTA